MSNQYTRLTKGVQRQNQGNVEVTRPTIIDGEIQWTPNGELTYPCLVLQQLENRVAMKAGRMVLPVTAISVEILENGKRYVARIQGRQAAALAKVEPGMVIHAQGDYAAAGMRNNSFHGEFWNLRNFTAHEPNDDQKAYFQELIGLQEKALEQEKQDRLAKEADRLAKEASKDPNASY